MFVKFFCLLKGVQNETRFWFKMYALEECIDFLFIILQLKKINLACSSLFVCG